MFRNRHKWINHSRTLSRIVNRILYRILSRLLSRILSSILSKTIPNRILSRTPKAILSIAALIALIIRISKRNSLLIN